VKKPDKNSPFAKLKDVKLPDGVKNAPQKKVLVERVTAEEEELAFHRLVSGVTKLGAKAARVPVVEPVERTPRKTEAGARAEEEDATLRLADLTRARFEVTDDGVRAEGKLLDVAPDVMRRLRRGQLAIDGRLDLHGMNAGDASLAVIAFLRKMRAQGEKCVLVIHGRGRGVLRGEMSAWLSQGPASASVAAFASQADPDGESGSMLVLIRR
jgi:DNA-nicking Smr family endonuclease